MNITNQLGQLTELWCQLDFCERGIVLSQPTNPSSRYDFIAEINNKLYRIQCKTAHLESNNRISIRVKSKNWNNGEYHSYINEIDYFYTHWNNKSYLIPIECCTETNKEKFIRLGKEEDYHSNNINAMYGKDYELDVILDGIDSTISERRITIETANRIEAHLSKAVYLDKVEKTKSITSEKTKSITSENFNLCIDCGKPIGKAATRCVECYKKHIHPLDIPTREELKELIRTTPFTKIGEKYGRTDNAVRKWCDYYNLPRKKADIDKISDEDWLNL